MPRMSSPWSVVSVLVVLVVGTLSVLAPPVEAQLPKSGTAPSAGDGEKLLRNKIQNEGKGNIKLVSFSKTNGQMREVSGTQVYKLEYEGEIEFLADCYWGPFEFGGTWSGNFHAVAGKRDAISAFHPQYMGKQEVRKGQKTKVAGSVTFERTEKGWRGEDGKIY